MSIVPSVTKTQVSTRLPDSIQPAGKVEVIRKPKVIGRPRQQAPKLQSSKKAAFLKQNAPPKSMDTESPVVLSLSQTQTTPRLKHSDQPLGKAKGAEKVKQPFKKATFQKENGTPKASQIPAVTPLSSVRPPPAKRRKAVPQGNSQPLLA